MSKPDETKQSLLDIAGHLKELKFKKKLFGGVDQLDVWNKLYQIDKEYQSAIKIQREYYERKIRELEESINKLGDNTESEDS